MWSAWRQGLLRKLQATKIDLCMPMWEHILCTYTDFIRTNLNNTFSSPMRRKRKKMNANWWQERSRKLRCKACLFMPLKHCRIAQENSPFLQVANMAFMKAFRRSACPWADWARSSLATEDRCDRRASMAAKMRSWGTTQSVPLCFCLLPWGACCLACRPAVTARRIAVCKAGRKRFTSDE